MTPFNLSKRPVNPYAIAIASGVSRRRGLACACQPRVAGLTGLGFNLPGATIDVYQSGATGSVLDSVQMGMNFVPGLGTMASSAFGMFRDAIAAFEQWFGIGAGRNEADVIVPLQNELVYNRLGAITNQILLGTSPSISDLANLYLETWQLALGFMEFVSMPDFTDRRASGQALNTVMPYLDGTCGYAEPLGSVPTPGQRNCIRWGDGTLGGPGTDGMLGAIGRAIEAAGGIVPDLGNLSQQAGGGVEPGEITLPPGTTIYNALPSFSSAGVPMLLGVVLLLSLASNRKLFSKPKE